MRNHPAESPARIPLAKSLTAMGVVLGLALLMVGPATSDASEAQKTIQETISRFLDGQMPIGF